MFNVARNIGMFCLFSVWVLMGFLLGVGFLVHLISMAIGFWLAIARASISVLLLQ